MLRLQSLVSGLGILDRGIDGHLPIKHVSTQFSSDQFSGSDPPSNGQIHYVELGRGFYSGKGKGMKYLYLPFCAV